MNALERTPVDVLIIDNLAEQARTVHQMLEGGGLHVVSLLFELPPGLLEEHSIPPRQLKRVFREIENTSPSLVMVDMCLSEWVFPTWVSSTESSGTWTGPALMQAIQQRFPALKIGSYSAYPAEPLSTDIEQQKIRFGVAKTPHWELRELAAEIIKSVIQNPIE